MRSYLLLLGALCILLSGCISITQQTTVTPDLTLRVDSIIDFTEFLAQQDDEDLQFSDVNDFCDKEKETQKDILSWPDRYHWLTFDCDVLDNVQVHTKGILQPNMHALTKEIHADGSATYRYKLSQELIYQRDDTSMSTDLDTDSIDLFKTLYNIDLALTMPGVITSAEGATSIDGDTAHYDTDAIFDALLNGYIIESVASSADVRMAENFKERVCTRVAHYSDRPTILERLKVRILNRFGFSCE